MSLIRRVCLLIAISLVSLHAYSQLSGTYTINQGIGSSSTNFTSFQSAIDAHNQEHVKIYPVPNSGHFKIQHDAKRGRYLIFDVAGRTIATGNLEASGSTDVSITVPTGVYKISIITDTGSTVIPFLVD